MKKQTLNFMLLVLCSILTIAQVQAQTTTYDFESSTTLTDDFDVYCDNTNGSITLVSAIAGAPTGSSQCAYVVMGGTSKKSAYLTTKTNFANVSELTFYLGTNDKGKTSLAVQMSADPTFATGVTDVLPLTLFNAGVCPASSPSNNQLYLITLSVPNLSGYVRFQFYQPSSSGKKMWIDDLTVTATAAPVTPTITAFEVSGVQATINQTAKTITATLPMGSNLTALTPVVTTANATGYTPTGAQNFSTTVVYTATDGTNNTAYNVDLSVATATASTDATLSDLKVDGTTVTGFSPSTLSYNVTLPTSYSGLPTVTATANESHASVVVTPTTSTSGTATVLVTAEDGVTQKTYTINFTQTTTPPVISALALHQPEIYETPTPLGGYATPLTTYNGREYEVYYAGKRDSKIAICTGNVFDNAYEVTNASTASSSSYEALDGWFVGTASSVEGGDDGEASPKVAAVEEFAGMPGDVKTYNNTALELRVQGYDQFRIVGKDNNATESKGKHLNVYIDGVLQSMTLASSATVRTFNMSLGEHVLKVEGIGSSNNYLYAFSLRTSGEPTVRYVSGNDSTQKVPQTTAVQPVTYRMRNTGTFQLSWIGTACTGVTLTPNAAGDTAVLGGVVTAPVGVYQYKIASLNGSSVETSSLLGTLEVVTEVHAAVGSADSVQVNINEAMQPNVFEYFAVNDADVVFTWNAGAAPAGIVAQQNNSNKTFTISGTPTLAGAYAFTITANGGNVVNGLLTVVQPAPKFTMPANANQRVKATTAMLPIVFGLQYETGASATGLPTGVTGTYSAGQFTISGTPVAETSYPQVYHYTVTAQGEAAYVGAPVTVQGTITVIDPQAKALLYLYKTTCDSSVYTYLADIYDITTREAANAVKNATDYTPFDAIVVTESVDATDAEVLNIIKNIDKPVLNFKSFTYQPNRLDWGVANNGSDTRADIIVKQPNHPIFNGISGASLNAPLTLLSKIDVRGIQPVDVHLQGSVCLATATKREVDEQATALHDVPGNLRHAGFTSRYLLLPLSTRSTAYLTATGKQIIKNSLAYILGSGSPVVLPELKITAFSVDGKAATINQQNNTISITLPANTPLTALRTDVTLSSAVTTVNPATGTLIDYSQSYAIPVEFMVSDMINTRVYNVVVLTATDVEQTSLAGVLYDGRVLRNSQNLMLYVYDAMGRRVAVSNADINMEHLPRGVYLVQGANGTLKIMR